MSDYTQTTDFSAKDALSSGDPNKVANGADIDTELGAIATAIATKADDSGVVHTTGNETIAGTKTFSTAIAVGSGGTGATTAAGARTNLGLGTIATQAASAVSITGGSVTGITDLAVADGGTAASTAAGARTNLGLDAGATGTSMVLVSAQTASGSTSLTFSGLASDTLYLLEFVATKTNAVSFSIRVNNDSTANRHGYARQWADTTPTTSSDGTAAGTEVQLDPASFANGHSRGTVHIAGSGTQVQMHFDVTTQGDAATSLLHVNGGGVYNSAALSSFVVFVSAGTFSGKFNLYSLKNS